ncbi:MAG: GNAT family N-acetyltransferase [Anaerolineae bacterium]
MDKIIYETASYPLSVLAFEELQALSQVVFDSSDALDSRWRLDNMPDPSGFLARCEGQLVGFKLGYAVTSSRYYSWLGGINPEFRKLGIAQTLMAQQHKWIEKQGYRVIETEVREQNKGMIHLNTVSGFSRIGSKRVKGNKVLILRKQILRG